MEYLDKSLETPQENIAFDELLLLEAEQGKRKQVLRVWETQKYAVCLGRTCSESDDVFLQKCRKDNIEIFKRSTGGGTVLLGKGCLNYSLILSYETDPSFLNIKNSYKYILQKIIHGFNKKSINLEYYPISDLALDKKKVSGNAQARKKKFFLHHGTFLYNFDIEKVSFT